MWSLIDRSKNVIELKENQTLTVGRSNADILLSDDASISRMHAKIEINANEENKNANESKKITKLTIIDCRSKYGSYLLQNGSTHRITDKGYVASHMDQIRFGLKSHVFTLVYKFELKYFVLTSGLTSESKKRLEKNLKLIGGTLIDRWQDNCTHLTTSTTGLTEKISCALAAGIPIISLNYWSDVQKAQEAEEAIPDFNNYIPPFDYLLKGISKVTLRPNPKRRSIFKGLNFFYFDQQQCHLYSTMINLAGGKFVMFDESSFKKSDCIAASNIFVQPSGDTETQDILLDQYNMVNQALKGYGFRSIPTTEIPLAILHCSLEQYCNPKFKYRKLLLQKDGQKESQVNKAQILVPETQDLDVLPGDNGREKITLPETVPASQSQAVKSQILCHPFNEDSVPSFPSRSQCNVRDKREQQKIGELRREGPRSIAIDDNMESEREKTKNKSVEGKEKEEERGKEGQLKKASRNEMVNKKEEEIKKEVKEEEEVEVDIGKSSEDKSIWNVFTSTQNDEAENLKGISFDSDGENDNQSKKRTKQRIENTNQTKKKKIIHGSDDEIDVKEEVIELDEKPGDIDSILKSFSSLETSENELNAQSKTLASNELRHSKNDEEDLNGKAANLKENLTSDVEKGKGKNADGRPGSTINSNFIDEDEDQRDKEADGNDIEEVNQNHSKWISRRKKNDKSSHENRSDITNSKALMNVSLGYKIKFVSMVELQGKYRPFEGKRNRQSQNRSILIPPRLTSADFHKWIPPKTVNKQNKK